MICYQLLQNYSRTACAFTFVLLSHHALVALLATAFWYLGNAEHISHRARCESVDYHRYQFSGGGTRYKTPQHCRHRRSRNAKRCPKSLPSTALLPCFASKSAAD